MSSPMRQATVLACVLTATSNITAQLIKAYRNDTPYTIDWVPVLQFVVFTALNAPPNFLWQEFLESSFPSHTTTSHTPIPDSNSNSDSKTTAKDQDLTTPPSPPAATPTLSIRNTATKFLLDQTISAALNTLAFSLAMGAYQGLGLNSAMAKARSEFWPLMSAGWRLWPLVSLVNFTLVRSVQGRALVGGLAGVVWGVYLSLVAGG